MKRFLLISILLLSLAALAAVTALFTETGSRQVLQHGLSIAGDPLHVGKIRGTLGRTLRLEDIELDHEGTHITIARLLLQWRPGNLLNGQLHVEKLVAQGVEVVLPDAVQQPAAKGDISFSSPLAIRCDHCAIEQLVVLQGDQRQEIHQIQLTAVIEREQALLQDLSIDTALFALKASASGGAVLSNNLPFTLAAQWELEHPLSGRVIGRTLLSGDLTRIQLDNLTSVPFISSVNGEIRLPADQQPVFDLQGRWQQVHWPLTELPLQISSPAGNFALNGTPEEISVSLATSLQRESFPAAEIKLVARATPTRLLDSSTQISTADGTLDVEASADWSNPDAISLDTRISARQFNPGIINPELPGELNLAATLKGELQEQLFYGELQLKELSGQLRQYPIRGNGRIAIAGKSLDIDRLALSTGSNTLRANGQLNRQTANLQYQLEAPDLAGAWPGLQGRIASRGQITGSLEKPRIRSQLQAAFLRYDGLSIEKIDADADVSLDESSRSHLDIQLSNLSQQEQQLSLVIIKGTGRMDEHAIMLSLQAPQGRLRTALEGRWRDHSWTGSIRETQLSNEQAGQWNQRKAAPLKVRLGADSEASGTLENFCLGSGDASLCLDALLKPGGNLEATSEISRLPLSLLAQGRLPAGVTLAGSISSRNHITRTNGMLAGNISSSLDPGSRVTIDQDPVHESVELAGSSITASLEHDEVTASLSLAENELLDLQGELQIGPAPRRSLLGQLQARIDDLSLVSALAPQLTPVEGNIKTRVDISGNLEQPAFTVNSQLMQAHIGVQPLGIMIEDLAFTATTDKENLQRVQLQAAASSGEGKLTARGTLLLDPARGWPLQLAIRGDQFEAVKIPQAQVALSPELNIDASLDEIAVTGKIVVPKAHIEIQELPENTVTVSKDEVIISAEQPADASDDSAGPAIRADVTVELGSDIRFSGKGLSTGLTGRVRVIQQDDATRVSGLLNTSNGQFKAYGQDLTISKGQFQFNGPPDNPWIHVVASRVSRSGDITAYVTVEGPLQSAQTKVSASDSSLSEQDALAYLITGRSISKLSESDKSNLASAAIAFGAERASWLTDKIGIEDVSVTEGDTLEDTMVALGTHLTPGFYVGVSVGLFNHEQSVVIKHSLTDNISVQAESGESQRIELNYGIEYECLWSEGCGNNPSEGGQ